MKTRIHKVAFGALLVAVGVGVAVAVGVGVAVAVGVGGDKMMPFLSCLPPTMRVLAETLSVVLASGYFIVLGILVMTAPHNAQ